MDDLADKRVLITGASTGIGAAAAKGFADHGARVMVHYNASHAAAVAVVDDIVKAGGRADLIQADLTEPHGADPMVHAAAEAMGGLDILVNNAGSLCGRKPFGAWDDALYDRVMALNVRAVIDACQAAAPYIEAAGGGAIINLGSIAAVDGGGTGAGHYAAAKAYVHALTRHLARDLAKRRIRVNAIAPGVIDTPFHAATPPERMAAMQAAVPWGRLGEPQDCVGPILFLASERLSGYVTGQILHVNGGQLMP
jgi:3-oxoacyl-[acyl-carrier protein] reductase